MLWRQAEDTTAPVLDQLKQRGYILGVVSNSDGRIDSAFQQLGWRATLTSLSTHSSSESRNPIRGSFNGHSSARA